MKYDLIYADPPWRYNDNNTRGAAEHHYDSMSAEELQGMDIKRLSKENSALAMWTTFPLLKDSLSVMEAWSFPYKTILFVWVKTHGASNGSLAMGNGHYTRSNAELCLLGIQGKGLPILDKSILNTPLFPRRKHSQKPKEFHIMLERLFGEVSRLELFARDGMPGWHSHGNQITQSGFLDAPKRIIKHRSLLHDAHSQRTKKKGV